MPAGGSYIDKPKDNKLYYSISEVAEMFKVNQSLLRLWDGQFEMIQPKLNKKGNRMFTPQDIEVYKIIFKLKEQGLTIQGIKKYLEEYGKRILKEIKTGETQYSKLETKLRKIKQELIALSEKL